MKVTVTKPLNVRVGKPSVNAPTYQYLAPGSELEVDGHLYEGDLYDGLNTWLKDEGGNYYWSGGIAKDALIKYPWWITDFGVNDIWRVTKGQLVTVIILDSGVSKTPDLENTIIERHSVIGDEGLDFYGHGTLMASIIAGNGKNIYGVSPDVKIISIKITDTKQINVGNLITGFQKLQKLLTVNTYYVVNCSLAVSSMSDADRSTLSNLITNILQNSNLAICSAVGNDFLRNPFNPILPASIAQVISVDGLIKLNSTYARLITSNYWNGVKLTAPGDYPVEALSTKFQREVDRQGSSHACAYATGIISLFLSHAAKNSKTIASHMVNKFLNDCTFLTNESPPSHFLIKDKLVSSFYT